MRLLPRVRPRPPQARERVEPRVHFPTRPPVKVSWNAVSSSLKAPPERINPYRLPTYAKGVLPDNRTEFAMDDAQADIVGGAWDFGPTSHGLFAEGLGFMGYPYLAELSQRAEYRRASEVLAEEMTRKWIKLKATGEQDKTDQLQELGAALDQFKVRDHFRAALEHDGFFGIGMLFLDFGDRERDPVLGTRLYMRPEIVGRGRFRGFRLIDPTWMAPNRYDSRDPTSPSFYQPQTWFVMGAEFHATRMLKFVSRPLPDILKPAYNFGGLSLSQMMKPYVDNWLRTRQSVSDLINSFTVFNLATNLEGLMAGAGGAEEAARLEVFANMRNNRGLLVTNKDTEQLQNISAPLGTLDHLQAQSQEHICSVIAVPLVKYLGVTPSGLNASAEGEIRTFYDGIAARQEKVCSDNVRTVLQLLQLDLWGEVDDEIDFEWVPLWEMDEQQAAGVRKQNADTDQVLTTLGAIDPDEVRQRIAAEPDSPYAGLDMSKPAPGPQQPGEGEGAMPGVEMAAGTQDSDSVWIDALRMLPGGPIVPTGEAFVRALRQPNLGQSLLDAFRSGDDDAGQFILDAVRGRGADVGQAFLAALRGGDPRDAADIILDAVKGAAETATDEEDDAAYAELDELPPPELMEELGLDPEDVERMEASEPKQAQDEWDESKVKRDDQGQFATQAGGGAKTFPAAAVAATPHPQTYLGKAGLLVKALVTGGLNHGAEPQEVADKVIKLVATYKHPTLAAYANKALAHFANLHGVPAESLGKAKVMGQIAGATKPEAKAPQPSKKPVDVFDDMNNIATGKASAAEKIAGLELLKKNTPHPGAKQHADQLIDGLKASSGAAKPAAQAKPDIPQPFEPKNVLMKMMFNKANQDNITAEEKVDYINGVQTNSQNAEVKAYAEAVIKSLGGKYTPGGPAKPQAAPSTPPASLPDPHPGSKPQAELHKIASVGGVSNEEKIKQLANHPTVIGYPDGFSAKYAASLIDALGGNGQQALNAAKMAASNAAVAAQKAAMSAHSAASAASSSKTYAPSTPEQQKAYETLKAKPHYELDHNNTFQDAQGNKVKAKYTANTEEIPGDFYATVSSAYGDDPTDGHTNAVDKAMQNYTDHVWAATPSSLHASLTSYKGSGYDPINDYMRGLNSGSPSVKKHVANIRKAMETARVPADTPIWRGLRSSLEKLSGFADPEKAVGRCFVHQNFASVSRSKETAKSFGTACTIRCTLQAGSKGYPIGAQGTYGGEREIVLPDHTVFKITKVTKDFYGTGKHLIDCEVIGQSEAAGVAQAY